LRTEAKLTLANLVYNLENMVFDGRRNPMGRPRPEMLKSARITPIRSMGRRHDVRRVKPQAIIGWFACVQMSPMLLKKKDRSAPVCVRYRDRFAERGGVARRFTSWGPGGAYWSCDSVFARRRHFAPTGALWGQCGNMSGANTISELAAARKKSGALIGSAVFFSVFSNLLMLTGPLFMLQVYDRVLGSRAEETLVTLFALVALLFLLYGFLEFARGRVMARVGARIQSLMNARVFGAVLERAARRRRAKGERDALLDLEAVRDLFTSPVLLALFDAPWTPVFLVAIFVFHPALGWLAVAGGGLLILIAFVNQLITRQKTSEALQLSVTAAGLARQAQDGGDLVWAQGMHNAMARRWLGIQNKALAGTIRANDWTGSFTSFSKAFRFFLQSAMLALGAFLVLQNEMTAGAMIAASILLGRALAPVEQGLSQWPVVQRAAGAWRALSMLLDDTPMATERTRLPAPEARLSVANLTVTVPGREAPILRGISFEVGPGQALGVIGKSGSGKTSLARAIVGLVNPRTGEIRLGGATLDQYGPEALGQYLGYLPQSIRLFEGTVAENIAQMAIEPEAEKVIAAARKARVHDIILRLPQGYDTRIGADDAQFSGGQKQRLALARALFNDPILLVLDEPNSALDAEGSEALNLVVKAMKQAGKAVIIMTHRPTAIAGCDTLLVLDGGRSVARGPRDEIIGSLMRNASDVRRTVDQGTPE
jgi:ATP-binding cassette, subfamily C, type I secretion system permease/ATPase